MKVRDKSNKDNGGAMHLPLTYGGDLLIVWCVNTIVSPGWVVGTCDRRPVVRFATSSLVSGKTPPSFGENGV